MSDYNQVMQRVVSSLNSLSISYLESLNAKSEYGIILFASKIVSILDNNKDLPYLISKMHRKDLLDSLVTHSDKYIKSMELHAISQNEINEFKNSVDSILRIFDTNSTSYNLLDSEQEAISELLYKMTKKSQMIFAQQTYNNDSICSLLALATASSLPNLSLKDQSSLYDQLLLIKEVWFQDQAIKLTLDHPKFKFFSNPYQALELDASSNLDQTFANVISYFTRKNNTLEDLTDENLTILYDRLKNYDWNSNSLPVLIGKLHIEARFRYSYNRLTDSGYELLKRFQSFDAITNQIENPEYSISESYLLRKRLFIDEILSLIARHLDNIRALDITKNEHLALMLNKISSSLLKKINNHTEGCKAMLSSLKSKLDKSLEPHVQKRYFELDQFAIKSLQQKYFILFENITSLIEEKGKYKSYLNKVFISKLTSDYYLPNWSNSIEKLRIISKDKKKMQAKLSEINFIEIYQSQYLNKTTSFNFKRGISETDLKSSSDYISGIIREIVLSCTALQLEVLYKPLKNVELSETQTLLKDEIISQIRQRTSIKQMLYSILVGRKKEYDKLTNISKNIKTINSENNSAQQISEVVDD